MQTTQPKPRTQDEWQTAAREIQATIATGRRKLRYVEKEGSRRQIRRSI